MVEKLFHDNPVENWVISLIIIVATLIACKLFSLLNKYVFRKIVQKAKKQTVHVLVQTLESPLLLGFVLFALWISLTRLNLSVSLKEILGQSYIILITLNITWFIARFIDVLIKENAKQKAEKKKALNQKISNRFVPLIRRFVLIIIWITGIITALSSAGFSVTALFGTLGIGGIAVALAAQDTVKNIIGGITLFADRTFKIGDRIKFDSMEGTIEDVGIRRTKIRTLNNNLLTIPNYKIVDSAIEKIPNDTRKKIVLTIGLPLNTSAEKMKKAIELIRSIPNDIKEIDAKDLSVTFSDICNTSFQITFIYYVKKTPVEYKEIVSRVNLEILNRFEQTEINFNWSCLKSNSA